MMPQMPQGGGGMPQAGGGNFLQALMSLGQGGQQGGAQGGGAPGSTAQLMCPNCHGPITVSIAPAQGGMPPMGGGMPQMGGRPGSTF